MQWYNPQSNLPQQVSASQQLQSLSRPATHWPEPQPPPQHPAPPEGPSTPPPQVVQLAFTTPASFGAESAAVTRALVTPEPLPASVVSGARWPRATNGACSPEGAKAPTGWTLPLLGASRSFGIGSGLSMGGDPLSGVSADTTGSEQNRARQPSRAMAAAARTRSETSAGFPSAELASTVRIKASIVALLQQQPRPRARAASRRTHSLRSVRSAAISASLASGQ